jgi:phospholipid-binding lipoprotein MlaA
MSALNATRSAPVKAGGSGRAFAVLLLLAALAGCAAAPTDRDERVEYTQRNDPAEPANRAIFDVNVAVDDFAVKPVAEAYRDNVPEPIQTSLRHAASNLADPEVAFNHLLQGHAGRAWTTLERFVVNSTIGLAGLFDVASDWDLKHEDADFGQTFGVWGIGEGPFVELPLLGPSNARDAIGTGLTMLLNPLTLAVGPPLAYTLAMGGTDALDQRVRAIEPLDDLRRNSIDYYAALRSAYRQERTYLVDSAAGKNILSQMAYRSPASDAGNQ